MTKYAINKKKLGLTNALVDNYVDSIEVQIEGELHKRKMIGKEKKLEKLEKLTLQWMYLMIMLLMEINLLPK